MSSNRIELDLRKAYKRAHWIAFIENAIKEAAEKYNGDVSVPDDLSVLVKDKIEGTELAWDDVIKEIAWEEIYSQC